MNLDREDWKMIRVGAIFIAVMLLFVFAVLALAGCGGSTSTAQHAAAPSRSPQPATSAPASPAASGDPKGAAICASLAAAPDPVTPYLNAVIAEDNLISGFSTASPGDIERAARAYVAAAIAANCPRFTYLTKKAKRQSPLFP